LKLPQEPSLTGPRAIEPGESEWQKKWFIIIFESDTKAGKAFDLALLLAIVASMAVVMLDSIPALHERNLRIFVVLEWFFTILFTLEYILRIVIVKQAKRYSLSTLGIIDLIAILPSYLSLFFAGYQYLLVVRSLRLLRVFRILKLAHFVKEIQTLTSAILASARKISVFMLSVFILVVILGSIMYLVEHGENGFNSIPVSIYWAVITITTVGYGDLVPVTDLGKAIASIVMLIGYSIIAIPTGIVTVELTKASRKKSEPKSKKKCPRCKTSGHLLEANYCFKCGESLD
jgi:voltage-gated potassium channel